MKVSITIDYLTGAGERLMLLLHGAGGASGHIGMHSTDGRTWSAEITADHTETPVLRWNVCLVDADGRTLRSEWPRPHVLSLSAGVESVSVSDRWHDSPPYAPLMASAFTQGIFRRGDTPAPHIDTASGYTELQLLAPQVEPGQTVVMAGSCEALGSWRPELAPRLDDSCFPMWRIRFADGTLPEAADFKFCIVDTATGAPVKWEECDNRRLEFPAAGRSEARVVMGLQFEERQASWRGTGTVIPVFSLRSEESFGIGDFADLRLMVDWVAATGQNFLQILPINDTTMTGSWSDSYPYNSISVFALHPVYLRVDELGTIDDSSEAMLFATRRRELNSLSRVDYERVFSSKMEYARHIYRQNGAATLASAEFRRFCEANASWLDAYAAFSVLRDRFRTADITAWGEYAVYDEARVRALISEASTEADLYRFLQYHLDRQLREAVDYARSRGVVIKGDIPIGISRNSVDAWQHPELFNLDWCAGAPPDDFAVDGQNWGFPTYNWERMAEDDYAWWRARLRKMAEYFDAYRIDHLLGFFRIWQIPRSKRSGLLGVFYPALPFTPGEMADRFGFRFDPSMAEEGTSPIDVLFIEDAHKPDHWHPAINGCKTPRFEALDAAQQEAYRRLHNDFFYFRHNDLWEQQAMRKLTPLLSDTDMLACGEDLGMIPACVKPVMDRLRILSLEVQRMPKTFGQEWADTASYPYLSVATTSTHDMPGLRLWLDEDIERSRRLLASIGVSDTSEVSSPECCEAVVRNHLLSPSMLCILPWQDWMAIDGTLRRKEASEEVINIPAVANHYWRYRMHLTIEQLLAATPLTRRIAALVASTR